MNKKYYLYLIACKTDKYFVYCSTNKTEDEIRFHTKILYDFFTTNEMSHIVKKVNNVELTEVDSYVKKYMYEYGIENVRGGTYCQEELPEYMIQTIQDEINTINYEIVNNENIINEILEDYSYDIKLSKNDLQKKIENCKKELKKYYTNFLKCKNMKTFMKDNIIYYVSKDFLNEFGWVRKNILEYDNKRKITQNEKTRYKHFINMTKHLINIYVNHYKEKLDVDDENIILKNFIEEENIVFIKYPEFIFDNYFYYYYSDNIGDSSKIIHSIHILQNIENICTYMINRLDELQFDVISVDITELSKHLNTRIKYYSELYNKI
jgi:hypothetical protein